MLTLVRPHQTGTDEDADADALQLVDSIGGWLAEAMAAAAQRRDIPALRRHARDQALLLMLFWRPVSAAELTGVRVENVTLDARLGLDCEVHGRNGARRVNWRPITRPSLRHLCPLRAVRLWLDVAGIDRGPLFPRIERGGALSREALPANSVLQLLLDLVEQSETAVGVDPANAGDVGEATAPVAEIRKCPPRFADIRAAGKATPPRQANVSATRGSAARRPGPS